MWKVGRLYKDLKAGDLRYSLATHTHLTREYTHLPRGSKDIPNSGRKEIMQFHLPTDTEERPKLTFLIKHALKHRQPKRTICGFGLQRSFGGKY